MVIKKEKQGREKRILPLIQNTQVLCFQSHCESAASQHGLRAGASCPHTMRGPHCLHVRSCGGRPSSPGSTVCIRAKTARWARTQPGRHVRCECRTPVLSPDIKRSTVTGRDRRLNTHSPREGKAQACFSRFSLKSSGCRLIHRRPL